MNHRRDQRNERRDQRRERWEQHREHLRHRRDWDRAHNHLRRKRMAELREFYHQYYYADSHRPQRGPKILFRIFFTFLLAAIVLLGGLGILAHSFAPTPGLSPVVDKNIVLYLNSLQRKLNQSLSEDGIKALTQDLQLKARVDGFENLADQQGLPKFSDIAPEDRHFSDSFAAGRYHNFFFVELKGATPRAAWFVSAADFPRSMTFPFVGLAAFILFIMFMSFMTIRWMMSPVKAVLFGVNQISSGDLKFRIHTRHRGEFQMIGEAFNRMADNLEKMLVAKDQLLRDVSHELRSPLTRVGVAVDLMNDEKLKSSIKEDLRKMDEMVSEILEFYRVKEGSTLKKSPADLSELASVVAADYKTSGPGVQFVPTGGAEVVIDAMQIERVLRNLIENAVKYSGEGSTPILVSLRHVEDAWELSVKDFGVGIAEKDLPHIFEPFYRADAARSPGKSGFGLGLAIAKSIAEAHGGSLRAESVLGNGAEFILTLPADTFD